MKPSTVHEPVDSFETLLRQCTVSEKCICLLLQYSEGGGTFLSLSPWLSWLKPTFFKLYATKVIVLQIPPGKGGGL